MIIGMERSELKIGDRVTHPDDPESVGVVEKIEDRWTVWVRFMVPGREDGDTLDFDPQELTKVA